MNFIKNYMFELDRLFKWLVTVASIMAIGQIGSAVYYATSKLKYINDYLEMNSWSINDYVRVTSADHSAEFFTDLIFQLTIMIPLFFILVYSFWILYRDWFGKQKLAYRLFMQPVSRINLYAAKLVTIGTIILFLAGLQYILLNVDIWVIKKILPLEIIPNITVENAMIGFKENMSNGAFNNVLDNILPINTFNFFVTFITEILIAMVIFWGGLVERSYKIQMAFVIVGSFLLVQYSFYRYVYTKFYYSLYPYEQNVFLASWLGVTIVFLLVHSVFILRRKVYV